MLVFSCVMMVSIKVRRPGQKNEGDMIAKFVMCLQKKGEEEAEHEERRK